MDPYFNDEAKLVFRRNRHLYINKNGKRLYGGTTRDEYLAECLITALNLVETENSEYYQCGIKNYETISEKDPQVVALLQRYFNIAPQGVGASSSSSASSSS